MNDLEFKRKYLKYKNKYFELKGGMEGGGMEGSDMEGSDMEGSNSSALSPPEASINTNSRLPGTPRKPRSAIPRRFLIDDSVAKEMQEDFIEMLQEAGTYDTYTKLVETENNYYIQLQKIEDMVKTIEDHEDLGTLTKEILNRIEQELNTIDQELNTIETTLETINKDTGLEGVKGSFRSCCSDSEQTCCVQGGASAAENPLKKAAELKKKLQNAAAKTKEGVKKVQTKKKDVATSSEEGSVLNGVNKYRALCKTFGHTALDWPQCANINCKNIVPCKYTVNRTKNIVKNKIECNNCYNKYNSALTNYTLYKRDNKIPEGKEISEKLADHIASINLGKYPPAGVPAEKIPPREQMYPLKILDSPKQRWKKAYCENIIDGRDVYMNEFFNPETATNRFEWLKKKVDVVTVNELQESFSKLLAYKEMYIMNLPHEDIERNCSFLLNQINHYLFGDIPGPESYLESWQNDNIFEIALENDSTSVAHQGMPKLVVINYAYACCYIMPPCECTPNIHLDFTFRKRDLDHIIGAHMLNEPWNIQTLCGNCHFTKTIMAGDTSSSSST